MSHGMSRGALALVFAAGCQHAAPDAPPTTTPPTAHPPAQTAKHSPPPHAAAVHRATADACEAHGPGRPDAALTGCKSDADCKDHPRGHCNSHGGGHEAPVNLCEYDACLSDRECSGGVCECDPHGNACIAGTCRTDADCGAGGACSPDRACWNGVDVGHWTCVQMQCPVG